MKTENYSKPYRYVVQNWVCDYGVYDTLSGDFIGNPIKSQIECIMIVNFLNSIHLDYEITTKQH